MRRQVLPRYLKRFCIRGAAEFVQQIFAQFQFQYMGTCAIAEKPDGFGEIELFCCGKQAVSVVSKHVKLRRFTSAR